MTTFLYVMIPILLFLEWVLHKYTSGRWPKNRRKP